MNKTLSRPQILILTKIKNIINAEDNVKFVDKKRHYYFSDNYLSKE